MAQANIDSGILNKWTESHRNLKTKTSRNIWTLSPKRLIAFNVVQMGSILGAATTQVPHLENVSFSKFVSEPPQTLVKQIPFSKSLINFLPSFNVKLFRGIYFSGYFRHPDKFDLNILQL